MSTKLALERDMAHWLESGALSMSLSAVRFRTPLGVGFSEKYNVSPFSFLGHLYDKTKNCCTTVCSPWS